MRSMGKFLANKKLSNGGLFDKAAGAAFHGPFDQREFSAARAEWMVALAIHIDLAPDGAPRIETDRINPRFIINNMYIMLNQDGECAAR